MKKAALKALLDEKVAEYNQPGFIEDDPISIPHQFTRKQDIEIAGLLTATIAWGQRKTILKNAQALMKGMDHAPYLFITQAAEREFKRFEHFVHRTFNGDDCLFFLQALRNYYQRHETLETAFVANDLKEGIMQFRSLLLETPHLPRSEKHLSSPAKGSSAKRLNMFLRWMVRDDKTGVDFGLWKTLTPAQLYLPLDVHTGNTSRKLKLLHRKQNDWKAVWEITRNLRKLDPIDPIKYDFALFGMGLESKV